MANVLEISALIKERIKNYHKEIQTQEEGSVISIADGIALVSGLYQVKAGEILLFPNSVYGIAQNLETNSIGVILLGDYTKIRQGDPVKRTKKVNAVYVGDELLGRIINPLGTAIDGKPALKTKRTRITEENAPGIMARESVSQPLETGIMAIDSMIPIGKGQRELIIGDRKTGKSALAIDSIINQKGKKVNCVYVSIGQKNSTLAAIVQRLSEAGAMGYTTIVSANASDSDAMQYLAPYSGMAVAEEWMAQGKDVLIVFDDLSKHAVAYRSLSLLLRRPPGREAYPGDVFYLHSRLLERAAKLNPDEGGGSITALPIIETQAGDISAYIPTNVISITDGQIFLLTDLFNSGQRPAVDPGKSVSRVGSSAQIKAMKTVSSNLKLKLASFNDVKSFAEFSTDLDENTNRILDEGNKILKLLKQPQYSPYSQSVQTVLLFIVKNDLLTEFKLEETEKVKADLLRAFKTNADFKAIIKTLDTKKEIDQVLHDKIMNALTGFFDRFGS